MYNNDFQIQIYCNADVDDCKGSGGGGFRLYPSPGPFLPNLYFITLPNICAIISVLFRFSFCLFHFASINVKYWSVYGVVAIDIAVSVFLLMLLIFFIFFHFRLYKLIRLLLLLLIWPFYIMAVLFFSHPIFLLLLLLLHRASACTFNKTAMGEVEKWHVMVWLCVHVYKYCGTLKRCHFWFQITMFELFYVVRHRLFAAAIATQANNPIDNVLKLNKHK